MSSNTLELVAISRSFGDVVALADASFYLRPDTVHALLGENGAGTTSRIAFGMLSPDAGTVRVNGDTVRFHAPSDAIAHGIGIVLAGAFGAAVVAQTLGADAGMIGRAIEGSLIGALFAIFAVSLRINQVIAGTAMTLLALGLTGGLSRTSFGASMALQFTAQALDWRLPYQLFLATPYLVTLAVLVVSARGGLPPAALGSLPDDT